MIFNNFPLAQTTIPLRPRRDGRFQAVWEIRVRLVGTQVVCKGVRNEHCGTLWLSRLKEHLRCRPSLTHYVTRLSTTFGLG